MPLDELSDGDDSNEKEVIHLYKQIFMRLLLQNPDLRERVRKGDPVEEIYNRFNLFAAILNNKLEDVMDGDTTSFLTYSIQANVFIHTRDVLRDTGYGQDSVTERSTSRISEHALLNAIAKLDPEDKEKLAENLARKVEEKYVMHLEERQDFAALPSLQRAIEDMHTAILHAVFSPS